MKTIVYDGLQYGGKQKSAVLLVEDFDNLMTSQPQNNKINAAILQLINTSKNFEGEFTAKHPEFLLS